MKLIKAKNAYNGCYMVDCDMCHVTCRNQMVYHCPKGYFPRFHKGGYDLCLKCANQQS